MTPEEIWEGDLFGRRDEAEQLIAYLESVADRPFSREDRQAYTIAVEAGYGEGKSFFLRRLAKHIGINHPVAFVDAWADDLADEPLTALAATLQAALEPFMERPEVADRLHTFWAKASKVTKLVSKGLIRRGATALLTGGVVGELDEVLSGASNELIDAIKGEVGDVSKGVAEDAAAGIGPAASAMEKRIADFKDGQAAVAGMKASLAAVVAALRTDAGPVPPIVIVIDELDRCRPTYAIKLLEEIKHLFDVPGLVFVLAMNAEQLAYSVSGAYGAGFNGRAYLSRFIDREYQLATPEIVPLIQKLCRQAGLLSQRFQRHQLVIPDERDVDLELDQLIAVYLHHYGISARDAFKVIDVLQTAQAIIGAGAIVLPYFLPLVIGHVKGLAPGTLPPPIRDFKISYYVTARRFDQAGQVLALPAIAEAYKSASQMTTTNLQDAVNSDGAAFIERAVLSSRGGSGQKPPISALERYPDLIGTLARFSNPQLDSSGAPSE